MTGKITKQQQALNRLLNDGRKTHDQRLCLYGLELQSLPFELFDPPFSECLLYLDARNNKIESISCNISLLTNLTTLVLSGNMLTHIPIEVGLLRKIVILDLSRNQLKSLPTEINNLKDLETINLSGNMLKVIPEYLLRLPRLKKVFCIRNPLENIPKAVAADGLDEMRKYLSIRVEEYEIMSVKKRKDPAARNELNLLIEEIEKEWILEEDQFKRKTKNASTQLDDAEAEILRSNRSCYGLSTGERSFSTQTEPNEDENAATGEVKGNRRLFDRHNPLAMKKLSNLEKRAQKKECSGKEIAIENLVKIFRIQMNLISENKAKFLMGRGRKRSAVSHFENDSLFGCKKIKGMCHCCGLKRRNLSTSEYGTMSFCSQSDGSLADQNDDSCDGNDGSYNDDSFSDIDEDSCYSNEDSDVHSQLSDDDFWCSAKQTYLNACKELVIKQHGIAIKIPAMNLSGHQQTEFSFQVVNGFDFSPSLSASSLLATPIVFVTPHGAKFYSSAPAIVELPLNVVVENEVKVHCFVSDTGIDEIPEWIEISSDDFEVSCGIIKIKTNHFSLFCATVSKDYAHATKDISSSTGGTLTILEVDGLQVNFTQKSLAFDITAEAVVLFDDSEYAPKDFDGSKASPIVALGPNGTQFEDDVEVTLPLPGAEKVFEVERNAKLSILESQTSLDEVPSWKELCVPYRIKNSNGLYTVSFNVRHFTLFEVMWDGLSSAVNMVKNLIPLFTHRVYFQALMSDCHHSQQFGLCIMCHRAGNPPVFDCSQFPIDVGKSKPRDIKNGELIIELKSALFTADEVVGESGDGLMKTENFTGMEFDKQFALKFHDHFKDGIFGKVCITRKESTDARKDIADFVLQKSSIKRRNLSEIMPTELETEAIGAIASLLAIEDRWKELGLTLGYTRREVNLKFGAEDPIDEMLTDYLSRGGSGKKFITAMHEVARRLKLIPLDQMTENKENRRLESREDEQKNNRFCSCPPTPEKTPVRKSKRKISETFNDELELSDARLDQIAGQIAKCWKQVGRHLCIPEKKLAEIEQTNQNEGEREKAFQMFMVWREMDPDSFVAENLGRALCKCDLKYTARQFLLY